MLLECGKEGFARGWPDPLDERPDPFTAGRGDMAVAAGPEQERSLGSGGDVAARWGGPHREKVRRGGAGQGAPRGRSGDLQAVAALASASRRMDTATVVALLHYDGGGCVTSSGEAQ